MKKPKVVFDTKSFIKRAQEIHGNQYDYSLVVYKNNRDKIKIICLEHGVFEQCSNSHLSGRGCPECGRRKTAEGLGLGVDTFLYKSKLIHGDRYSYALMVYKDTLTKIDIICSKHGVFKQKPSKHLRGQGCPHCAIELVKYNVLTTETFIAKAKVVHGEGTYDYSQVDYKKSCIKVKIICPKHGLFEQTPNNHLRAMRCEKCTNEENGLKRLSNAMEFTGKARKVHGNKYDYSQVDYKGSSIKVKIVCPDHGVFEQAPSSHLNSRGCPFCEESRGERKTSAFLDSMGITYERQKTFELCRHIRNLSFDFYIPSLNTCIEYDGRQHYFPSEYFGGVPAFEKLKKTDAIKTKYCLDNGVRLIRITYKKKTVEAIEAVLRKELIVTISKAA